MPPAHLPLAQRFLPITAINLPMSNQIDAAQRSCVEALAPILKQHARRLVTAESCTGGAIAAALTSLAGSSEWFERGLVTYSNAAKQDLLGVSAALLETHGAVSEEVVRAMALGALSRSPAHVSVAVSGVAGPGGGTPAKPVGTVCLAWADVDGRTISRTVRFSGDRQAVRAQATYAALRGLLEFLGASPACRRE